METLELYEGHVHWRPLMLGVSDLWILLPSSSAVTGAGGSSVGLAAGYGLDDRGWRVFDSQRGLGIFLFTTESRPALRPT